MSVCGRGLVSITECLYINIHINIHTYMYTYIHRQILYCRIIRWRVEGMHERLNM